MEKRISQGRSPLWDAIDKELEEDGKYVKSIKSTEFEMEDTDYNSGAVYSYEGEELSVIVVRLDTIKVIKKGEKK